MLIRAMAPTRVDLAGGTIDLWPIHQLLEKKATVNCGVTLPAQVNLRIKSNGPSVIRSLDQKISVTGSYSDLVGQEQLPLVTKILKQLWDADFPAFEIETTAKSPAGAGLGGSSCLAITLIGAFQLARKSLFRFDPLSDLEMVQLASDIEANLIKAPTGIQDYWGALRGGVNVIHFPPGSVLVQTFSTELVQDLNQQMVVCYSGQSRASAINNWEIFKRVFDGDQKLIATLNAIGETANACASAMLEGNLHEALEASREEWSLRCRLWPNIETPQTKKLDQAAIAAGARFSRVCGAGGGGVMAVFVPPERRAAVCRALSDAGGQILEAQLSQEGLRAELIEKH